jgi:peptidoglycan/xylan/chitin deacetylase (PgdA/CDA1 family)
MMRGSLRRAPPAQLRSRRAMMIVVAYHYVRPRFAYEFPGIHGVTPAELEAQLRLLGTAGEFVSLSQLRDAVRGTGSLPARALLVTFDDGLREQMDHALPVLDRLGIPAAFFVNTWPIAQRAVSTVHKIHLVRAHTPPVEFVALLHARARRQGLTVPHADSAEAAASYPWDTSEVAGIKHFLNHQLAPEVAETLIGSYFEEVFGNNEAAVSRGLYMDHEHLRMLGARGYLGSHGDRHVPLGRLPRAAVQENVRISLELLAEWTGVRPFALSYPYGTLDACPPEAGAAAAAVGVEIAFTSEPAANMDLSQPLHLARFDCNDLPGGRRPCSDLAALFTDAPRARRYG